MKNLIKNKNFWILLSLDVLLLHLAYYLSYFIRFEGVLGPFQHSNFIRTVWLVIPFKIMCFILFRLYRGMWRYISIPDLMNIVKATFVSSTGIIMGILFFKSFYGFSRSVFAIDAAFTLLFIGGVRVLIRIVLTKPNSSNGSRMFTFLPGEKSQFKRLLIIGAGDAGEKILREIRDNPRLNYHIIGFLDDDPRKIGMHIHRIPILSTIDHLDRVIKEYEIDEILIAISSATAKEMRRIVELCGQSGLKFRTIPGIGELIDGRVSVKAIRDVSYEDLMGRESVHMELGRIGKYLQDKPILVTGAGGSIGSELCRQIARFSPDPLILLDCTENNLYQIETEFLQKYPRIKYIPILGNILNLVLLDRIFCQYNPQVVFHAAAYKHVPMMELNPWEAVSTNVKGTQGLLETVHRHAAESFVFVSTDKAVRPVNVMGATKRVAELLTQGYSKRNQTRYMSVRFGNVIGSSGSVIPLFRKQIERGGPVTVTHPEVTRFFMTIPEAAQLILQAGAMGKGGEIFILDMGTPIRIADLARDLIRLSGFVPQEDIDIEFIGLRPGEKLYEELITEGEGIHPTQHEKILVLQPNSGDLALLNQQIESLMKLAGEQDAAEIKEKLKEIVPEYQIYPAGEAEKVARDRVRSPDCRDKSSWSPPRNQPDAAADISSNTFRCSPADFCQLKRPDCWAPREDKDSRRGGSVRRE